MTNEQKHQEDVRMLQEQILLSEQRIMELEENALHFQYDSESNTLNVFGKKKEVNGEEQKICTLGIFVCFDL